MITLSGDSGWWIGMSIESFNGVYNHAWMGDPVDFFAATAFGGSSYGNTPVGYVAHTSEPGLGGIHTRHYPGRWARGWTFAEAAWVGRNTAMILVVGDPLVRR